MNNRTIRAYQDLLERIDTSPLSQVLPIALRLALDLQSKDFEEWVRLEKDGYVKDNPAFTSNKTVPEYRTIVGEHVDIYRRPILIADPRFAFINEYRLRQSVEELERMANTDGVLAIQDRNIIELIQQTFHVEVYAFSFSPIPITGILSSIRSRLVDWIHTVEMKYPLLISEAEKRKVAMNMANEVPKQVSIHFGDGTTIQGNFVIADSIANSFNKADAASVADDLKDLLKQLAKAVGEMSKALPEDVAEQAGRDLEMITAEAISKTPRKQWWQLSAEGLKKAAETVGEIGKPVLQLAAMIIAILNQKP